MILVSIFPRWGLFKKSFCLHIHLPTVLCPLSIGYRLSLLNAIPDIMNSKIFENEMRKIAMRKKMVCSPTEIAKEILIFKNKCLYNDFTHTILGPLLIFYHLSVTYADLILNQH